MGDSGAVEHEGTQMTNTGSGPEDRQFLKWLSRHLVSLVLIYWHLDEEGNSKGEPHVTACSGTVMAFGDFWFLVSAGHVLNDLDELIAHPKVKIVDSFIVDSLGSQAVHHNNIPFNYVDCVRYGVFEDGLDFGLVMLRPHERRLMEANGVQPITIENWINQDLGRCQGFILLGIPANRVEIEDRNSAVSISVQLLCR